MAYEMAVQESGAEITVEPLATVVADRGQLTQLFQNLVGNAIKYRSEVAPEIHISGRESGEYYEFCVQDNGIGIDPKFYERVFEIFQRLHNRREYSGTGIGLALCKRIVERFGGNIWLESTPGAGSAFYFTIPRAKQQDSTDARTRELDRVCASD